MSVLIIDDHALFSAGIKQLYETLFPDTVVESFVDCSGALESISDPLSVNLVMLDLHIPGNSGERNLHMVRSYFTVAKIVIVSGETDPRQIISVISQGASGFIPKSSGPDLMVSALKIVAAGGVYLPPIVNQYYGRSAIEADKAKTEDHPLDALSPSVREVVKMAITGLSNQAIAEQRGSRLSTIKNQLSGAYKTLGVKSRAQLVLLCGQHDSS